MLAHCTPSHHFHRHTHGQEPNTRTTIAQNLRRVGPLLGQLQSTPKQPKGAFFVVSIGINTRWLNWCEPMHNFLVSMCVCKAPGSHEAPLWWGLAWWELPWLPRHEHLRTILGIENHVWDIQEWFSKLIVWIICIVHTTAHIPKENSIAKYRNRLDFEETFWGTRIFFLFWEDWWWEMLHAPACLCFSSDFPDNHSTSKFGISGVP